MQQSFLDQLAATNDQTLSNVECYEPEPVIVAEEDILEDAVIQQEQTIRYNEQLDLDLQVALTLLSKVSPEVEELMNNDDLDFRNGGAG